MPKREDMDRHDRPSWREMDKKRDRSAHGAREGPREPRTEKERETSKAAKDAYLKKLDQKLFGGSKKRSGGAAESAVRDARGTRGFSEACDAYIEKSGFPASGDLLLLFLDHENAEIVLRALDALAPMARAGSVDRDALAKALRRVKSITDDADVESAADELLESV
ncbi:MAG: hypothetical protein Q8R92_20305 [Deltaproteobacteria bacterium]|nr:hypothetical protein [Deltaproteobacteria bacterium]